MSETMLETGSETLPIVPSKARLLVDAINRTRPKNRNLPITDDVVGEVAESLLGIYLDSASRDAETGEIDDVRQRRAQVLVKYALADLTVEGKYRLCLPTDKEPNPKAKQSYDKELQHIAPEDNKVVPMMKGALDVVAIRKEIVTRTVSEVEKLRAPNDAMTVTVRSPSGQGQLRVLDIHDVNSAARDTFLQGILGDEQLAEALKESVEQKLNFPKGKDEALNDSSNKLLIAALQLYFSYSRRNFMSVSLAQGMELVDFLEGKKVDDIKAVMGYAREFLKAAYIAKG